MTTRPKVIGKLYEFLKKNHGINRKIQATSVASSLASRNSNRERALLLLHRTVNTQSQPDLEAISKFFQEVSKSRSTLQSFASFRRYLMNKHEGVESLFDALRKEEGWGNKTSALLIRNLAIIAVNPKLKGQFWADLDDIKKERIHLPVDAVILEIFRVLATGHPTLANEKLNSFTAINNFLATSCQYNRRQMLIWDDLWFWGFISQKSRPRSKERKPGWNPAKYWSILEARTNPRARQKIEKLSGDFLEIIKSP